ncbi:protein cup [Drosophila rhopaloa]|uniref:Protein cup n=1 Tax=Drosophila rhopaloa TaxID=1041015 RepID=A0A6P4FJ74_DRORH|nr:protein cup [Drosophila rhopaloa]
MQMAEAKQENGAGALKIATTADATDQAPSHYLSLPARMDHGEEVVTPGEKAQFEYPPPPPPPTPVQAPPASKATALTAHLEHDDDETNSEKWEDPCAPPPPPPLPANAFLATGLGYLKLPAFKLKDALEKAITKLEAKKRVQKTSPEFSRFIKHKEVEAIEMLPRRSSPEKIGVGPIMASMSMALILHPKTKKPAVIMQLERRLKIAHLLAKQNRILPTTSREAIPMYGSSKQPHEDEGLALQVLSARASTPYTQPTSMLSCTAVSCDLEHDSPKKQQASKDTVPEEQPRQVQQKRPLISATNKPGSLRAPKAVRYPAAPMVCSKPVKNYTRSHLLDIRNEMFNALMHRSKESFVMPRIATCDDIELEVRLRRMNLWRTSDGTRFRARSSTNSSNMNNNECMPAFYKNKNKQLISDESIIQSQPPQPQTEFQDPAIVNQRRIGSGRFNHSKWRYSDGDYHSMPSYHNGKPQMEELNPKPQNSSNMTVLQFFDNGEISSNPMGQTQGRPNTPVIGMSNNRSENETLQSNESSEDLSRANENYVKRVMSGFLVVSKPKSRDVEDRHHRRYRNQSEEPEWFSCGPTSRLDTIELCGFDEDEEKMFKESCKHPGVGEKEREAQKHKVDQNKYKVMHPEPISRNKYMPKSDSNNNQNVDSINKVLAADHHLLKDDKRSGSVRSFQFDKFNQNQQNYESGNYKNHPPQTQPQQMQQQTNTNNSNSKFMSFFTRERNTSSSSLNDFFKQAINHCQAKNPVPKQLGHMSQMPSVDQLEAKWRRNSLTTAVDSATKQSDNFQKLIGSLSTTKPQQKVQPQPSAVGSDAISNFIMQQQQYQQQQQKQHVIIQQQQQQTAFLAGLQLKAILGRADTQLLLLRLTKGEISKHGLLVQLANPRLTDMDREAITAVLQFTNTQQQQQQHKHQLDMLSSTVIASQLQNLHNLAIVQQTLAARQQQQHNPQSLAPQQLSQEDLQAHANVIMRNAVMKRKMEEQTSKLINGGGKHQAQQPQLNREQQRQARPDAASNALLQALISGGGNSQAFSHLMTGQHHQQSHSNNRRPSADANMRFAENQHFQTFEPSQLHFPTQYKQHYQQSQQQQTQQPHIRHQNNSFSKSQMQAQSAITMLPNVGDEFH